MTNAAYNATIQERGNGFPDVGDYVPGDDGNLHRVARMSRIHTGNSMRGDSNYVYAVVECADWSDCDEGDEFPALVVMSADGDDDTDTVTVEEMPDHHRGSHRAAGNWGVYPRNGATRREVSREEADEIIAADPDQYASIVGDEAQS